MIGIENWKIIIYIKILLCVDCFAFLRKLAMTIKLKLAITEKIKAGL